MNKSYFRYSLIIFILFLLFENKSNAQDEKFKAIFIYNFTKYISWPVKSGNFVITVLGNDDIIAEIENIAIKKLVGNLKIEVNKVNSSADINTCHIIFIPQSKSSMISQVAQIAMEKNILIITDKPNSCSVGSDINFVTNNGKITFEISKTNIEKYGLKVSGALLQLGILAD